MVQVMGLWEGIYLLRKTEVAGWDRNSAERDWRPLVWMGVCGTDSMTSSRRGEESSSVWSVVSLAALCLWKGLLFGDPGRDLHEKINLKFNISLAFFLLLYDKEYLAKLDIIYKSKLTHPFMTFIPTFGIQAGSPMTAVKLPPPEVRPYPFQTCMAPQFREEL